ncbi:hypothetical protein EZS27_014442 [termite gut metagenome]|uniref:ASCH domain-containing protein n=1 Tax=termite gut metagenome TaxID=433724 RepID=A0A5J4RWR1_9ZZZZ
MKTRVITVSKIFMKGHPKEGEPTGFKIKILGKQKKHTIRENYSYWEKAAGKKLSIRRWIDKPYKQPGQETIIELEKWGIQKITIVKTENGLKAFTGKNVIIGHQRVWETEIDINLLASNDGLLRKDFEEWFAPKFKKSNVFEGVIIHFTDFRY